MMSEVFFSVELWLLKPQRNKRVHIINARSLIFKERTLSSLIPYVMAIKVPMRSGKRTRLRRLSSGVAVSGVDVQPLFS